MTLLPAVITASLTLAGTGWSLSESARLQRALEQEKFGWQKEMEAERIKHEKTREVFASSVELAGRIASAHYQIGSFLESIVNHPERGTALFDAHERRASR